MSNLLKSGGLTVIIGPSRSIPQDVRKGREETDLARRAGVRVIYETTDITTDIAPWLLSVEFTDGIDKADDLQLTLWDDGRWRGSWAPDEGAKLTAEIHLIENGKTVRLPCGVFSIDELEASGFPQTVTIKAISAFVTTAIRRDEKTRAWENIDFMGIARTIADKAGILLLYSARNNPEYKRIDQKSKSDLAFLQDLGDREGLRVKVSDGKLIIFSQADYDSNAAIDTYRWLDPRVTGYSFTSGVTSAYSKAKIKYRDPRSKKMIECVYTPPDAPETGQTLRINERCSSLAEAERVEKNRLAAKNRGIKGARLDLVGDPRLVAGQNIKVTGYGSKCDGSYAIEEATHSLWPYTTSLGLRKING
ncbi:MAG: hypothetical protein ABFD64_09460 [Armatimonadota bacterium]